MQIIIGDPLDESPERIISELDEEPHLSVYGTPDKVREAILDALAFQILMADGAAWAAAPDNEMSLYATLQHLERSDYGVRASARGVEKLHALMGKRRKAASPAGGWLGRMFHGEAKPLLMLLRDVGWESPELAESRSLLAEIVAAGPEVGIHLVVHGPVPGVLAEELGGRVGRVELCGKFHQPHTWRPRSGEAAQFAFTGHEAVELGAILRKRFPSNGYV